MGGVFVDEAGMVPGNSSSSTAAGTRQGIAVDRPTTRISPRHDMASAVTGLALSLTWRKYLGAGGVLAEDIVFAIFIAPGCSMRPLLACTRMATSEPRCRRWQSADLGAVGANMSIRIITPLDAERRRRVEGADRGGRRWAAP